MSHISSTVQMQLQIITATFRLNAANFKVLAFILSSNLSHAGKHKTQCSSTALMLLCLLMPLQIQWPAE